MLSIAADPHKIVEISERLASDNNKWMFSDVITAYRKLYKQLRETQPRRQFARAAVTP